MEGGSHHEMELLKERKERTENVLNRLRDDRHKYQIQSVNQIA